MATINDIQTQLLTPIANAIRTKEGTTGKIPNSQLASRIENLQTGTKVEGTIDITENGAYDVSQYASANVNVASSGSGEDMLQQMVNATNSCKNLFSYYTGSSVDFIKNLDTSNVTIMQGMFEECRKITSIPPLDTGNAKNMSYMFDGCSIITSIPPLDTGNATDLTGMFKGCKKIKEIRWLNTKKCAYFQQMFSSCTIIETIETLDLIAVTNGNYTNYMFSGCTKLKNLKILNIKFNFDISGSSLLTLDSLIGIVKELINYGYSRTLTMGTANLEKIANTYVKFVDSTQTKIAEDTKGEVEVCESTDEGAMLLSDYATLKNWTLA